MHVVKWFKANAWSLVLVGAVGCTGPVTSDVGESASALTLAPNAEIVSLMASNGNFMSSAGGVVGSSGQNVYANRTSVGAWEKFLLVPSTYDSTGWAILCQGDTDQRQYFMTATSGGGSSVYCNRTAVAQWETFHLVSEGTGKFAFKTYSNNYLHAQNGGGAGVDATSTTAGAAETFTVGYPDNNTGTDYCVGAVGSNCSGVAVLAPCTTSGTSSTCWVSVGAQLHDSCCSHNPNGQNCGGPSAPYTSLCNAPSTTDCGDEWNHGCNDTVKGYQWQATFNNTVAVARPYVVAYYRIALSTYYNDTRLVAFSSKDGMALFPPTGVSSMIDCGDAPNWCRSGYTTDIFGTCHCN